MKSINKLIKWCSDHLLELICGFLLIFIPLYPKWPLADVLPGYIVRIRLEDVIIAFVYLIFALKILRKKVEIRKNPLFVPIIIYLFIGLISSLSALFITRTVPLERVHIAKLLLHFFRRIEYMGLAFLFFSAIKTRKQLARIVTTLALVGVMLSIYGFGQKYSAWPVYSTMNREFSKGWRLVLTEFARVPSTFAGHYDFAAYLVMVLSIFSAMFLGAKLSKKMNLLYIFSFILCYASLLLTASRTSFIAYLVSISVVCVFLASKKGFIWGLSRWGSLIGLSLITMLFFGDLSSRFAHVLRVEQFKQYISSELDKRFPSRMNRPSQFIPISTDLSLVYTDTDTPPTLVELPPDVYEAIPETLPEATLSARTAEERERIASLAGKPRTYSPAAFTFGLSSAIRLDALWPRAIQGFRKNPLLGSGYSTLVKIENTEFTEAESTDNDYLRSLGETGILGFLSFYGILVFSLVKIWEQRKIKMSPYNYSVVIGIGGAIIGLLVNGLYIDVFEASKVAYTFWGLLGVLFATLSFTKLAKTNK